MGVRAPWDGASAPRLSRGPEWTPHVLSLLVITKHLLPRHRSQHRLHAVQTGRLQRHVAHNPEPVSHPSGGSLSPLCPGRPAHSLPPLYSSLLSRHSEKLPVPAPHLLLQSDLSSSERTRAPPRVAGSGHIAVGTCDLTSPPTLTFQ